jgi:hypothetical protein
MPPKKWIRSKIIGTIKSLHLRGVPLNSGYIQKNHSDLYNGAVKEYRTWKAAVEDADLDYELIRIQRVPYTQEELIKEIRLLGENEKLYATYVKENHSSIYSAAVYKFGKWEVAVEMAGFDYLTILKQTRYKNSSTIIRNWNKEHIMQGILVRLDSGKSLVGAQVEREDNSLYRNAVALYGKWTTAVEEATGCNYCNFRYIPELKYPKDLIAKELKRLDEIGHDLSHLNFKKNNPKLYSAILNRKQTFGSYEEALEYAGIDVEKHRKGPKPSIYSDMNKKDLIGILKELNRKGEALNARAVNPNLYNWVKNHFGTWEEGILAAGIDYDMICPKVSDEIKRGRQFEMLVKYMFENLNRNYVYQKFFTFEDETSEKKICIPDFSVECEKWIDVKLHSWTVTIKETIRKYCQYTRSLTILYLQGNKRNSYFNKVSFLPVDSYYKELENEGITYLITLFESLKVRPLKSIEIKEGIQKGMINRGSIHS